MDIFYAMMLLLRMKNNFKLSNSDSFKTISELKKKMLLM